MMTSISNHVDKMASLSSMVSSVLDFSSLIDILFYIILLGQYGLLISLLPEESYPS